MYSENLNKLIELALADGVLTDKERQILFKKAEEEGVDHDEFEMVLSGMLFEKNKKQAFTVTSTSDKFGDVKKCPSCGAAIAAFSSVCSECDFEFRDTGANKSVELLSQKLEDVIKSCEQKSYKMFGIIDNPNERQEDIARQQKEVISNFPVPQNREDILELLNFILPKTKVGLNSDIYAPVWRNKFSEVLNRAKIAFEKDAKMLAEISNYEKRIKINPFNKMILFYKGLSKIQKIIAGMVIFYLCLGVFGLVYLYFQRIGYIPK